MSKVHDAMERLHEIVEHVQHEATPAERAEQARIEHANEEYVHIEDELEEAGSELEHEIDKGLDGLVRHPALFTVIIAVFLGLCSFLVGQYSEQTLLSSDAANRSANDLNSTRTERQLAEGFDRLSQQIALQEGGQAFLSARGHRERLLARERVLGVAAQQALAAQQSARQRHGNAEIAEATLNISVAILTASMVPRLPRRRKILFYAGLTMSCCGLLLTLNAILALVNLT